METQVNTTHTLVSSHLFTLIISLPRQLRPCTHTILPNKHLSAYAWLLVKSELILMARVRCWVNFKMIEGNGLVMQIQGAAMVVLTEAMQDFKALLVLIIYFVCWYLFCFGSTTQARDPLHIARTLNYHLIFDIIGWILHAHQPTCFLSSMLL